MGKPKVLLLMTSILLIPGCGGGDDGDLLVRESLDAVSETVRERDQGPAYDPRTATATVSGSILFEGTPPEMPLLRTVSDPFCARNAAGQRSQEVLVTDDAKLQNVMVYVRSGHGDFYYPPSPESVVLDQVRCVYIPRVSTIMVDQEMRILNSDPTLHNVHAETDDGTLFNFGQPVQGAENTRSFSEAGRVEIGCDLHPWMTTFVGVFDHPFHTISGESGDYQLRLPPGTYELVAWHERYGEQVLMLEVADNEAQRLDFTFRSEGQ